jgi:hypothetical protein
LKHLKVIPALLLLVPLLAGYSLQSQPASDTRKAVSTYDRQLTPGSDIRETVRRYGQAEVEISYPGFDEMTRLASRFSVSFCDGYLARLILSPRDAEEFIASGIAYKMIVPPDHKGFFTASSVAEAMMWQSYPTWKHYDTIMHKIAEHWPDVCLLDTIGSALWAGLYLPSRYLTIRLSMNRNRKYFSHHPSMVMRPPDSCCSCGWLNTWPPAAAPAKGTWQRSW